MTEKFIEHIIVEKRYSAHTITSYRKDLADFQHFYLETEGSENYLQADKKIIRNFIAYLGEKKLAKRTINRKLSTLRSFYLFLLKIGEIKATPMENISTLKFYPEIQIPFSRDEMANLQLLLSDSENFFFEMLIIETLYQTGMRKAELCNLLYQDVNLKGNEMKVTGKGNKQRIIPFSDELKQQLEFYAVERKPLKDNEKWFFLHPKGKKLGEKFVYSIVNKYLSLVTSKKKKSPHILRHSFATHVLENGAEISKVKKIMGHSSLASTQMYTHANIEKLKKVFGEAHPRAKK
ncbi:tyrosine-type recombinase/integrase [Chryseobacterium lacus]|uniref:tyrosine-type recombinase/integrase n=1 Tax=Chryseobacterium lacus TaxID=2058346 RepID=UPI000F888106|nr:tyrosine-type recombinase/integrase [Chryseobacterium lacus]RST25824.1 integrase [Chryseobacterium lacus]